MSKEIKPTKTMQLFKALILQFQKDNLQKDNDFTLISQKLNCSLEDVKELLDRSNYIEKLKIVASKLDYTIYIKIEKNK